MAGSSSSSLAGDPVMKTTRSHYPQPDRGWSWAVLAGAGGSHFLAGALVYSVGIMHTGILHKYQPDTVTFVALIGAIYSGLPCLAAPVASVIINRFGCRVCCVLGGFLCFAGYSLSVVVTSLIGLLFTYGFLAGFGVCLAYSSTNITVGYHFHRLRGVASGLSNSFQAIGILCGGLMFQTLLESYGVSGSFLLLGAISSHFCFFGAFFRRTVYETHQAIELVVLPQPEDPETGGCSYNPNKGQIETTQQSTTAETENRVTGKINHEQVHDLNCPGQNEENSVLNGLDTKTDHSVVCDGTKNLDSETTVFSSKDEHELENSDVTAKVISETMHEESSADIGQYNSRGRTETNQNPLYQTPQNSADEFEGEEREKLLQNGDEMRHDYEQKSLHPRLYKDNSDQYPQIQNEQQGCESNDVREIETSKLVSGESEIQAEADSRVKCSLSRAHSLSSTPCATNPYVSVMLNASFVLHCASLLVSNIHISGMFLHLPEYALLQGTTSSQVSQIFLAIGAGSLVSKLSSGFILSDPDVDPLIISVGMTGINGIATCLFPLYSDTFGKQVAFSAIFGLYFGGVYAIITPVLVKFVGVHRMSHAYGLSTFFLGIGYCTGPILAAMIVDGGGTYNHSFFFLGMMSLCGSFLEMAAACFLESRDKVDSGKQSQNGDGAI